MNRLISNQPFLVLLFLLVNEHFAECQFQSIYNHVHNNGGDGSAVEEPNDPSVSASRLNSSTWYHLMYNSLTADRDSKALGCRLQKRYIKFFNEAVGNEQYCNYVPACKRSSITIRYAEMEPLIYSEINGTEVIMRGVLTSKNF